MYSLTVRRFWLGLMFLLSGAASFSLTRGAESRGRRLGRRGGCRHFTARDGWPTGQGTVDGELGTLGKGNRKSLSSQKQ